MDGFDRRMLELAGKQHSLVTRDQLRELGTERRIERRLASGVLDRVHESVYRVAGSERSWHQHLLAACLTTSGGSAASFRAAARLWSLPGADDAVEITSPRHCRTRLPDVRTHESYFLTDLDVTYVDAIPVTRPARLICDLGLLVRRGELTVSTLELAMYEALRRDLVDVARVWREWERLGGTRRPGGGVVQELLTELVPPIRRPDSTAELRLLQLLRAAGLPEPLPQHRVWLSSSRWYRLDFAWPHAHVYCEFDPYKWHGSRDKYMRDNQRRLELAEHHWFGVPVTDEELDAGAPLAIAVLRERLRLAS